MNEYEAINPPINFSLGGHRVALRRISTMRMRAIISAYWIELYVEQGRSLAAALPDADRGQYLIDWLNRCPSGSKLQQAIEDFNFDSPLIARIFCESAGMKDMEEAAEAMLNDGSEDELRAVIWFIQGGGKKNSDSQPPTSETSPESSAKNTAFPQASLQN